jgi:hypothetical protein
VQTPSEDLTHAAAAPDAGSVDPDRFAPDDTAAVMRHMNHEHTADALLIAQGLGGVTDGTAAVVSDLDKLGLVLDVEVDGGRREVRVPWSTRLEVRPQLRPEIAQLYRDACAALGVPARGEHP